MPMTTRTSRSLRRYSPAMASSRTRSSENERGARAYPRFDYSSIHNSCVLQRLEVCSGSTTTETMPVAVLRQRAHRQPKAP